MDDQKNKNAAFMPIGMGTGIAVGTAIGVATDNLALGLGVGVALGAGFGAAMMMAANKKDASRRGGAADAAPVDRPDRPDSAEDGGAD